MVTLHLVTTHLPTMQISIPYTTLFRSEIAKNLPSVLFVTTTNFIDAIDEAFLSRADLVMHFALPNQETIASILQHSLAELAVQWPALQPLGADAAGIREIAALCEGWNGRQRRKPVLAAA